MRRTVSLQNITKTGDWRQDYIEAIKRNHPDHGGDPANFTAIHQAYQKIKKAFRNDPISVTLNLDLKDLLHGCVVTAAVNSARIEFHVPAYTYPGTIVELSGTSENLTSGRFHVTLLGKSMKNFIRNGADIITACQISKDEAESGKTVEVVNFDDSLHQIIVPPGTTADVLIHQMPDAGFFKEKTRTRGKLMIIVEVL